METTNIFWFVLSVCIGGIIIALGLVLEFSGKQKVKRWGEILVLLGITAETIIAGVTAKEQWKLIQFARQNDPEKRHIVSVQARVEMEVRTKSTNDIYNLKWITLDFDVPRKKEEKPKVIGPIALMATNGTIFVGPNSTDVKTAWIEAFLPPEVFGNSPIARPDYEVADLNTNVAVHLMANFLKPGVEITKGTITLYVNSSVVKFYKIPPFVSTEIGELAFITNVVENPWIK
jgi:hypothetical protein